MIQTHLSPPGISKYQRRLSGADNEGIGHTKHGERYLLKTDPNVCVAEFVGALLCHACEVPVADPTVVFFRDRKVFGSRLESGVDLPETTSDLQTQVSSCGNPTIFSAVLAIDLALGNYDRHWHNWLPQPQPGGAVFLRAVDFSRAWPTIHPPLSFDRMRGQNTGTVWREWTSLGIQYDQDSALEACGSLEQLQAPWLGKIFEQLPVEWMVAVSGPEMVKWWSEHWKARVKAVSTFLEKGAWA